MEGVFAHKYGADGWRTTNSYGVNVEVLYIVRCPFAVPGGIERAFVVSTQTRIHTTRVCGVCYQWQRKRGWYFFLSRFDGHQRPISSSRRLGSKLV